jgi:hypothetical protein
MPPGGNRGSINVVFVADVVVELDNLAVPVVAAAEPDPKVLPVVWLLDVDGVD